MVTAEVYLVNDSPHTSHKVCWVHKKRKCFQQLILSSLERRSIMWKEDQLYELPDSSFNEDYD